MPASASAGHRGGAHAHRRPGRRRRVRTAWPTGTWSIVRLAALDPEQRAVIVLHYYLGLPLPDAAAALGIPVGTAKSRLHRALTSLRAIARR